MSQLNEIRALMKLGVPNKKIAKKLNVSEQGFPHRVLSLLRKECQDETYTN